MNHWWFINLILQNKTKFFVGLSYLPGGFHACCLSTLLDNNESSTVRELAGTLFTNLIKFVDSNRNLLQSVVPRCASRVRKYSKQKLFTSVYTVFFSIAVIICTWRQFIWYYRWHHKISTIFWTRFGKLTAFLCLRIDQWKWHRSADYNLRYCPCFLWNTHKFNQHKRRIGGIVLRLRTRVRCHKVKWTRIGRMSFINTQFLIALRLIPYVKSSTNEPAILMLNAICTFMSHCFVKDVEILNQFGLQEHAVITTLVHCLQSKIYGLL